MSTFEAAMKVLISWEGGYSCDPRDPGGETYCGISRKNWPMWSGWKFVDANKVAHGGTLRQGAIIAFQDLIDLVNEFYKAKFWNQWYEQINSQDICSKLFQHHVNMGSRAIRLLQTTWFPHVVANGIMESVLINEINKSEPNSLMNDYIYKLVKYYENLINEHPQLKVFEHEWMLRAKTIGKRPN